MNKAEQMILDKTRAIAQKAGDVRLNKSGTVGTEPISRPGDPQVRTEVKLGPVGSFQIPTKKDVVGVAKKAVGKVKSTVATMEKSAADLKADIKKNGISPMNDKGIIGPKIIKEVKAGKRARSAY